MFLPLAEQFALALGISTVLPSSLLKELRSETTSSGDIEGFSPFNIFPIEDESSEKSDEDLVCLENILFSMNRMGCRYSTLNDLLNSSSLKLKFHHIKH